MRINHNNHKRIFHLGRDITLSTIVLILLVSFLIITITIARVWHLDTQYKEKIYPNVFINNQYIGGINQEELRSMWESRNIPYKEAIFEFQLDSTIATVSGQELDIGYDAELITRQAYLVGRSGNIFSDTYTKIFQKPIHITPYFRWDKAALREMLEPLTEKVFVPPQDARFTFTDGKVVEFKPASPGRRLNIEVVEIQFENLLRDIPYLENNRFAIPLAIDAIHPSITTEKTNTFGIKERIGVGHSEFAGSIPSRVHNIELSARKMHGVLVPPGNIISYNKLMGDISQATGWQPAYIIKNGRTVLGDGGGVCQGSTTLFRAALNAGLPIIERQPHAYRVQYYEQGGFKPGLDATVYAPSVDLKIKNDTPSHILIQATVDKSRSTLTIELYGTKDGRKAEILNHQILSQTPPPLPLYQEDPMLPRGVTKQVDWAAWGARTVFTYRVTRGDDILQNKEFVSVYRPWRAIYLVGTQ